MFVGLGTIYMLIILAKFLGLITMGWFWVITSFVWLPIVAILGAATAILIGAGLLFGSAWILEKVL